MNDKPQTATITITESEDGGGVEISLTFNPEINTSDPMTPTIELALIGLGAINNKLTRMVEDEDDV